MKKDNWPKTRVKKPEPEDTNTDDWIIWAGWSDRITFEEIYDKTKKTESDVIKIMRKNLKVSSFKLWRKRVNEKSIKHRKKFFVERKKLKKMIFLAK